jgi:hypothetical protein
MIVGYDSPLPSFTDSGTDVPASQLRAAPAMMMWMSLDPPRPRPLATQACTALYRERAAFSTGTRLWLKAEAGIQKPAVFFSATCLLRIWSRMLCPCTLVAAFQRLRAASASAAQPRALRADGSTAALRPPIHRPLVLSQPHQPTKASIHPLKAAHAHPPEPRRRPSGDGLGRQDLCGSNDGRAASE